MIISMGLQFFVFLILLVGTGFGCLAHFLGYSQGWADCRKFFGLDKEYRNGKGNG